MPATARLSTPAAGGAIACFWLTADSPSELEACMNRLGVSPVVAVNAWGLRTIAGLDRGIVARFTPACAAVMPHAGPWVVRAVAAALADAGASLHAPASPDARADASHLRARFPEARSDIEARVLDCLGSAASPLAVDLLLAQPARWAANASAAAANPRLDRLVHPPLVAALGPPNVGKSSLLNALAGRTLALTADQPGTTRDHVGALVNLAGLVVRWMDAPGLDTHGRSGHGIDAQAQRAALAAAAQADLILLCGDGAQPPPPSPLPAAPALRVALRADLGGVAPGAADLAVSLRGPAARVEAGLAALAARVRDTLVPPADLADERPWRFFEAPRAA